MGIKDIKAGIKGWLEGDKKKEAFREKVKEAVADGRLDAEDLKNIEEARQELGVTDARDDKTVIRRAIYNEAVSAVKKDGEVTQTDAHELEKIQKFLALRNDQVEKTRWDLARLRTLTEIRNGNLPVVPGNNASLRGMQMEPDETAHYSLSVELADLPVTRGNDGIAMQWGKPYESYSVAGHALPSDGARPQGEGSLIITNRRLVIKTESGKAAAIRLGPQAKLFLYGDGLRVEKTVGNTILRFKSKSEETGEIVAELLTAVMK
jgi:hypothetical protein